MKRICQWTGTLAVLLLATTARAQQTPFAERGHIVLSAERLFGFVHTKQTLSMGGVEVSGSQDVFTLFTNPVGSETGYTWPRIALDGFISSGVSVGGAAGFIHISPDGGSTTGYLLAPRVGYAAFIGPRVAIWPRAGITYWNVDSDAGGFDTSESAVALSLEVPFVIMLIPRVALSVAPTADIGLGGSAIGVDSKRTDFGAQVGVMISL